MIILVAAPAEAERIGLTIVVCPSASGPATSVSSNADQFAWAAAALLARGGVGALTHLDPRPAPIYAIDADGYLVYYNAACVAIAGRTPQLGIDRWCLCAAIFTPEGEPVDYPTGPMATVLRAARPLRDLEALIERPDGERTVVNPYPTPALDDDGRLVGAVNLIVPLDGALHRDTLATAQHCRKLAQWIGARQANDALTQMAEECDQQARILAPPAPARN